MILMFDSLKYLHEYCYLPDLTWLDLTDWLSHLTDWLIVCPMPICLSEYRGIGTWFGWAWGSWVVPWSALLWTQEGKWRGNRDGKTEAISACFASSINLPLLLACLLVLEIICSHLSLLPSCWVRCESWVWTEGPAKSTYRRHSRWGQTARGVWLTDRMASCLLGEMGPLSFYSE